MDTFSALADPTRRRIVEILAKSGPLAASEISAQFDVSPSAISQHLKILREANLVRMEKRAQQRIYHINAEAMQEVEDWARQLAQRWSQRFDALERLIEVEKRKTSPSPEKGNAEWSER